MLVITNVRTAATLELDVEFDSLVPQDAGSRESASVEFDLYDLALTFDLAPEDEITISSVASPTDLLFGGFVRVLETQVLATSRMYHVTAYDYSTLLDRINVVADTRAAGESDADRLAYLMTTYGSGLLDDDPTGIAVLNASMPAQKFALLTLRQAIEQVLGTALATGAYRINASKKLDTWDSGPGLTPAPFDIVVGTPGVGEIAPETISIKGDTSNLYNAYWVRGATAAGSGWFTDAASIAQWGRREKYIDAPDSDLAWKAFNVGMAALADTAQPIYRGQFTVSEGDWRSEQRFALTSPVHDLVAAPFDTVRVTRRYLTGEALEVFDVEFGSPQGSFAAKHGKEARRSSGTGPGSGGWGPGGGSGGGGSGDAEGDCGCPPFDPCGAWESFSPIDGDWMHVDGSPIRNFGVVSGKIGGSWSSPGDDGLEQFVRIRRAFDVPRASVGAGMHARASWFFNAAHDFDGYSTNFYLPDLLVSIRFSIGSGDSLQAIAVEERAGQSTFKADFVSSDHTDTFGAGLGWDRAINHFLSAGVSGSLCYATSDQYGPYTHAYTIPAGFDVGGVTYVTVSIEATVYLRWDGSSSDDARPNPGEAWMTVIDLVDDGGASLCLGIATPSDGQRVTNEVGPDGDGTTTTGTTDHPFQGAALGVRVGGVDWTPLLIPASIVPSTGAYELSEPPPTGATVRRYYTAAVP